MWRALSRAREGGRVRPGGGRAGRVDEMGSQASDAVRAHLEGRADRADGLALAERGEERRVPLGVGLGPLRLVGGEGRVAFGGVRSVLRRDSVPISKIRPTSEVDIAT